MTHILSEAGFQFPFRHVPLIPEFREIRSHIAPLYAVTATAAADCNTAMRRNHADSRIAKVLIQTAEKLMGGCQVDMAKDSTRDLNRAGKVLCPRTHNDLAGYLTFITSALEGDP